LLDPELISPLWLINDDEQGLIDCECTAYSLSTTVLELAKEQNLPLCDKMSKHPRIARYMEAGYQILTF